MIVNVVSAAIYAAREWTFWMLARGAECRRG
jgi:hypothetical protein